MSLGRLTDTLTIGLFLAGVGVMAIVSLRKGPDPESMARENRSPAPPPSLPSDLHSLKKLPAQVDSFFNDRLAFRESLLLWHARAKTQLGTSLTEKVIVGKNGWLFLNHARLENPEHRPYQARERFEAWASAFKARYEWLAARGITYLVVITPEKQSVHSELLPAELPVETVWATDLLREWLKDGPIPSLDLLPALRESRSQGPLYFRTDTHWTDDGAYIGYREIVNRLGRLWPDMKPLEREQFDVELRGRVGDLGRLMRMPAEAEESAEYLRLKNPRAHRLPMDVGLDPKLHSPQSVEPQVWGTGDTRQPRCVLFHDSFAEFVLRPVLAEHFELIAYAPTASFDPKVVQRFRPQIVIQQIVERKIDWQSPDPHMHEQDQ